MKVDPDIQVTDSSAVREMAKPAAAMIRLLRAGLPFEAINAAHPAQIAAWLIVLGEMEGRTWDWFRMGWREPEDPEPPPGPAVALPRFQDAAPFRRVEAVGRQHIREALPWQPSSRTIPSMG